MYDLKKIKEDLSCVDAAESLGLKMQKKGNSISVLCPAHNDRHFGSCYIYDKKWKCFACGAGGDVYSLIHEATGLTNAELFDEAAKLTGNPAKYKIGEKENQEYQQKVADFPLTNDELELIGLKKTFSVKFVRNVGFSTEDTQYKKVGYEEDNEDYENVLYGDYENFSLVEMYSEDPISIKEIIRYKAAEQEERINKVLDMNLFDMQIFNSETIYMIKNELKIQLIKIKNVKRKLELA